jgi:phage baseplate assembly protein V
MASSYGELMALLSDLIRVGVVSSTNDEKLTARVTFADRDDVVSYDLPVLVKNSGENKDYWVPEVAEQVLCLFLPIGVEQGFILGSFYSDDVPPPATTKEKRRTVFKDGTSVEYDREAHTLTVDVPPDGGKVIVNAHTSVVVNSPKIDLGESSSLEPSVLGDKLADWITGTLKPWLDGHKHTAQGATAITTAPTAPFVAGAGESGGAVYSQKNRNQ